MSLPRSLLVVGVRGLQPSGVVRARGLHTSLVVTAGEKMGKPDPKWAPNNYDCEHILLSQVGSEEHQEQCDDSDDEQSQEAEWMVRTHDAHSQGQVSVSSWSSSNSGSWCTLPCAEPFKWQYWFEGCFCSRFSECAQDPDTKVLILTGADPYYCAGVDLSATIKPMHPKYVK